MMGKGRPASSSAYMWAICRAVRGFQGGAFVFSCATWSLITGVHTPLQSGSLASACQSCAVGAGLVGSLSAADADIVAAPRQAMAPINAVRVMLIPIVGKEYRKLGLPCQSFAADHEAAVNPRMALEVLGDGPGADVLHAQIGESLRVELEPRVVGREHQTA